MVRYNQRASILEVGNSKILVTLPGILAVGLIVFFFVISTIVAADFKRALIPDESWHIAVSQYFASTPGIPPDIPETYELGVLTHKPYLYHWINARLLNLLNLVLSEVGNYKILVAFRFVGVLYTTLAVVFCYLLSREIIKNPWWRIMPLFLLTSTLMFVFHSAGVNYDNLTNLCAFAGIYYLVKLLKGEAYYRNTLLWMIWILAGALVKVTTLPLLAVMTVIWVVYTFINRRKIDFKINFDWKIILLVVVFAVFVGLNFMLYGVNLIQYRAVIPSCTMVLTDSECSQHPVYLRDKNAADNLSIAQMFNGNAPDPLTWLVGWWFPTMIKMMFGFAGFKWYIPSDLFIALYQWWFLGVVFLAVFFWKKPSLPVLGLIAIVVFYILTLLQTNLAAELKSGFKHLGIQGRYLFPVLGGIYVLFGHYAERIPNRIAAGTTAVVTFALFFFNSPIWVMTYPRLIAYPSTVITAEEASVPLVNGSEVIQDFQSECSGEIKQLEVLVSSGQLLSPQPVKLMLTDMDNPQIIAEQQAVSAPGENQAWVVFPLNMQQNTRHRHLRIALSAEGVEEGQPLKIWNTTTNVYLFGDAIINGIPTNKDLVFRYTCKRPALKDWFYE